MKHAEKFVVVETFEDLVCRGARILCCLAIEDLCCLAIEDLCCFALKGRGLDAPLRPRASGAGSPAFGGSTTCLFQPSMLLSSERVNVD